MEKTKMGIEKVKEMPKITKGVRLAFRELVEAVKSSGDGEIIKFTREDENKHGVVNKINATTLRKLIEQHTKKRVKVQKYDNVTAHIKLLSKSDAEKEDAAMKQRAAEMKAKLSGKKKGQ